MGRDNFPPSAGARLIAAWLSIGAAEEASMASRAAGRLRRLVLWTIFVLAMVACCAIGW
jgi:hypothetical protein